MSTKLEVIAEEGKSEENGGAASEEVPTGSLFLLLSAELLLIIFQYIGIDDKKTYVRLAISGDDSLSHFIYTECVYLWRHVDLAQYPGITDTQLHSLLERIHAQSVTQTFVLDKNPRNPITGTGLEPLRHSRILESIDLRQSPQSPTCTAGPTGLNDELVADILSTMLPHYQLTSVKVRRQKEIDTENETPAFDRYCFPWSCFFANLCLFNARKCFQKSCSHCNEPLVRLSSTTAPGELLEGGTVQCTVCKEYSCQPWNRNGPCPDIQQCRECLEWCCSCRQVTECNFCYDHVCSECEQNPVTCPWCDETSCATCFGVEQCTLCRVINCVACGANEIPGNCSRCGNTYCEECRFVSKCHLCFECFCEECCPVEVCNSCYASMCVECHGEGLRCDSCGSLACDQCTKDCDCGVDKCSYCGVGVCHNDSDCAERHVCRSPADLEYMARDAYEGDDKANLCFCGNKHLASPKGQTFICGWLQCIDTTNE